LLVGCSVGPDYLVPDAEVPDAWHVELTEGLAAGAADLRTWWTVFDDATLESLIDRGVAGNLELMQAVARIDEARALRGVARGEFLPSADGIGTYQRNRLSEETSPLLTGRERTDDLYSVGLDASWEIDVFGRIRRSVEAATADLHAAVENYRDVLVILSATIATNYVDVRTFQERIRYARSNAERQGDSLRLTVDRSRAGLAPDLDVRQAELNLAATESTIPAFETALAQAIHRLGVLLGLQPSALYVELDTGGGIPRPPQEILVGVPANLLRQRPDIRRAERELAAETARIGVATADLYPRFFLLGTFTVDALTVGSLGTAGARSWSLGPSLRWNIFNGGRVRSNIKAQDARTVGALLGYENTVLGALEETENFLVAYAREAERRAILVRSVVAARTSVDLVVTLYRTGLTDFQNVLDMERSLFDQEDQLAQSEGLVTQNLIGVYRAMGGGWAPPADPPQQRDEGGAGGVHGTGAPPAAS
jgi:NodT family efflux transporter outer membrane factor (OMF) lipoprotein